MPFVLLIVGSCDVCFDLLRRCALLTIDLTSNIMCRQLFAMIDTVCVRNAIATAEPSFHSHAVVGIDDAH